jgi:glutamate/tyrosine decarboxylase-like PLP-dependent enzyme
MRELGYRVVDILVNHFETLRDQRPTATGSRTDLEERFREPLPEQGSDPKAVLDSVVEHAFGNAMLVNHPRCFAYVPSPGNFVATMADTLASGFNPFVGTWFAGSGPAEIELVTVDWLREICGLPESAGGLTVSGGSMANLTGLAVARHARLDGGMSGARVYFSDQTHSSVERALRVLGFTREQLRKLPCDRSFRLPLEELTRAVAADRAAGFRPFCVVANAGTTNTGAVDRFPELAAFCRQEELWLHADGAFGAASLICEDGRAALRGIEEVDSLSIDPHKWLFQPFEIGCALVRDRLLLRDAFRIMPAYLRDAHRLKEEINFCDHGVQLTRNFRALKLWMSLKVFGAAAFRDAVTRGFRLAELAETKLREAGCWEIVSPAQMAIVAFRYCAPGRTVEEIEAVNKRLVGDMIADGYATLSSTTLHARTTLRLCTLNPRTTDEEIAETVRRLGGCARRA